MAKTTSLESVLEGLDNRDIANIAAICELPDDSSIKDISRTVTWWYRSRARHNVAKQLKSLFNKPHETLCPSYEELLQSAAKELGIAKHCETSSDLELYIPDAVIVASLQKSTPEQRRKFFETQINAAQICESAGLGETSFSGVRTTAAMLAVANASGFGVFGAATTALGFVTHAVGTVLPFGVYTGMSKTIAVIIGPPGWLALGAWTAVKVTSTNWKKLLPLVIAIIQAKSRQECIAFQCSNPAPS